MFPILRQHWALWAAWILGSSFLLFANPWLGFGWAELVACVGSLALAVDRRTRRESLLAVGLPAIALLAVIDPNGGSAPRLVVDWIVFVGATLLGARTIEDQVELESIAGSLALGPEPAKALADFRHAVEREVGRARRHDRSFLVLSIAPHARSVHELSQGAEDNRVLARLAEARWMGELRAFLEKEIHLYADVIATEERVLCLIPEVEEPAIEALVKRLASTSLSGLGLEVVTGLAAFPRDALAVDDLIAAADEDRRRAKLESVSSPALGGAKEGTSSPQPAPQS